LHSLTRRGDTAIGTAGKRGMKDRAGEDHPTDYPRPYPAPTLRPPGQGWGHSLSYYRAAGYRPANRGIVSCHENLDPKP
jgi:hypothetical protein